jgi:hypothetical protein
MIYLVIFIVLAFVIYKTMTQSGNKSMNLYADKDIGACPPGLIRNAKYYNMCTNDPSKDPDFEDLCPPGKVPVGKECKCLPLSIHPDCIGKKFKP